MSTHNTEGRREIEAIKQRLEAAKVQVSTASNNVASTKAMATKMIESAQTMSDMADKEVKEIENTLKKAKDKAKEMKDALDNVKSMTQNNVESMQSQLETSKKEVQEVEKLLAEAEERAKQGEEGSSNKRRKISPQTVSSGITVKREDDHNYDKETDNEEDSDDTNYASVTVKKEEESDHAYDEETDKEEDDDSSTKPQATSNASANDNNLAASQPNDDMNTTTGSTTNNQEALGSGDASQSTSSNNVNQVIVEGCGRSEVNSTYTKVVGQTYDGATVYSNGEWCVIYRDSRSNWCISYWDGNVSSIGNHFKLYGSPNNTDSMTPPTNGWVVYNNGYGLNPAPKLRIVTANNDANSEGAHKVSGSTAPLVLEDTKEAKSPFQRNFERNQASLDALDIGLELDKEAKRVKSGAKDRMLCMIKGCEKHAQTRSDGCCNAHFSMIGMGKIPKGKKGRKCGKCGKPKKKHSYIIAEWDKRDDDQRTCRVCIKARERDANSEGAQVAKFHCGNCGKDIEFTNVKTAGEEFANHVKECEDSTSKMRNKERMRRSSRSVTRDNSMSSLSTNSLPGPLHDEVVSRPRI